MIRVPALLLLTALLAPAQPFPPDAAQRAQIEVKLAELEGLLAILRTTDSLYADVAIYHKAGAWALRYPEEFFQERYVADTLAVLDRGIARARELSRGSASWTRARGRLSRAYRSRVDGSLQPYGLLIPDSYDGSRPIRLDVELHGRNARLNEVRFLADHDSDQPLPPEQDYIRLEVYGRTNNAYRWAGESDVFEALASVQDRYHVDPGRIVLRGFSMGGAGTWHLGLHHPGRWVAFEAGAGFTETRNYAKQTGLPPFQEAVLAIYDAADYALNAFNLPGVGYGGEDDAQLQAAVNIRERLTAEGFTFTRSGLDWKADALPLLFLVGPKTGHRFHPESKRQSETFLREIAGRGPRDPDHLRFVTYTTRYNRSHWIAVDRLERHYQRAEVDARREPGRIAITTRNVQALSVDLAGRAMLAIDGQTVEAPPGAASLAVEKTGGRWRPAGPAAKGALHKVHGLQGPIDDAFLQGFLCVLPSGAPWHELPSSSASLRFERFEREFAKFFRGDVRVKLDGGVTALDISEHNLILFGDPASNALIARIAERLPVRWTRERIAIGGRDFDARTHLLALIYPNPLNPHRYVVLNSGHTFGESDLRGTNALLYPRLGDWAVLEAATGAVAAAGLFDEDWQPAP